VQLDCGENSQVISGWVFLNDWGEERSQQSCGFKHGMIKNCLEQFLTALAGPAG